MHITFLTCPATTATYTLSLHDALPISSGAGDRAGGDGQHGDEPAALLDAGLDPVLRARQPRRADSPPRSRGRLQDRKSTCLNSSHTVSSYAVFCLKKKKVRRNVSQRHR